MRGQALGLPRPHGQMASRPKAPCEQRPEAGWHPLGERGPSSARLPLFPSPSRWAAPRVPSAPRAAVFVAREECLSLSRRRPFPLILLSPAFLLTSACWESN